MIYFDGVPLETVAPVKIEDIRVSSIKLSTISSARSIGFGSNFVRMNGGSRTVTISFALLTNDFEARQNQLCSITKWARSDKPKRLELPYRSNMYLECICTALPDPSTRQWWESRLTLTFTTYDNPYWTSTIEKSCACGTEFFVNGDAPPMMQIRRTLASGDIDQTYSDGTDSMTFTVINAGDMVIDLNRQTAAVGSTSIMRYYTFNSSFIKPKTGHMTITGAGTVYWRERWE